MEQSSYPIYRQRSHSLVNMKRIWSRVILPVSKYKREDNGLDYTIDFYYHFQKMVELGYNISLNIPQTLTGAHDNYLQTIFQNEKQQIGKVKLTPSFSKTKFESQVEKLIYQSINRIKNKEIIDQFLGDSEQAINNRSILLPFVVMKQKISDQEILRNVNTIFNSYEYKRISTIDSSQIVQSYVFTSNMNASITRFFYSKSAQKGAAYKISNQFELNGMKQKQKDAWKVEEKRQNSCIILKVMFENKSFFIQTLSLIQCLENFFLKQVVSIVVDWIQDTTGRYYFIDMKELKMVDPKPRYRVSKSLNQLLSTVTCCMCLQTCNQSEISKILTTKLIINFYGHLKRRGINLSFRINFKKLSNFSRVCDLCYNLVVAQTKLIELQKIMSEICNFKNQIDNKCSNLSESALDTKPTEDIVSMYQWRFFFYLQDIKNFSAIFNQNLRPQTDRIFLALQINDSTTYFELKPPFPNNLTTKIIKIEYIFSETQNIIEFLHEAEVRIQIVIRNKSNKTIAEGCIHGIYDEGEGYRNQAFLQRKYKQILLFNQKSQYSILGMYIGLSQDGLKNTTAFSFTKSLGVLRPQNCILDCQSLPPEWMQIIYQNYSECVNKERSFKMITDDLSIDHKMQASGKKGRFNQRMDSFHFTKRQTRSNKSSLFPHLGGGGSEKRPKLVL